MEPNSFKRWTLAEEQYLLSSFLGSNLPVAIDEITKHLGRSKPSIYMRIGLMLYENRFKLI